MFVAASYRSELYVCDMDAVASCVDASCMSSFMRPASVSAVESIRSQRSRIGATSPPPTPTMVTPAMIARTVHMIGVVTVVAMPTCPNAATAPKNTIATWQIRATVFP